MSCKFVSWVWTLSIFGDDKKYVFESQFRCLPGGQFFVMTGSGKKKSQFTSLCFRLIQKFSFPDLIHRFHDTLSKLRTNRQNSCPILWSTSYFSVFAKSGGMEQFFSWLSIYYYYIRFLNDFIQNKTIRAYQTLEQNFFNILHFVFHRLIPKEAFFFCRNVMRRYLV